ncbi:aldehyde dehydrogenase [Mycolicibacterium sp.]|uniref:aldehyde dehydrogenase n=1 Tax=Mycolicibacterium sp. TaxID=2320850 RepID=UPI001A19C3F5|nr:aldehyde dehydrogenase [Mycolicibacterium sp.]MBJ7337185.1 aldehyde dehydrogenase [Mycolicibacterium sp.]
MQTTDQIYLGGKWIASSSDRTIVVVSPSTEEAVARVPDASLADVDAAVDAARSAFDHGPWPRLTPAERADVMEALLAELTARADELARVIATENGTPLMMARPAQVDNGLHVLRYYADLARTFEPGSRREGVYSPAIVRLEPVGTVAAILPWNVPFYLAMLKVAPAMAAGCTVVVKSAPETPLNANLLAEAADAVGVPPGVLNVICAGPEASERLVTHPGIDKVAFTGSTAVGKRIAGLAGAQLKRMTLELGGKSAAIVLDDADLGATMPQLIGVSMSLTGQFCTAQSRILVSRDRYDEAVAIYAGVAASLPVGGAFDEGAFIGPLISARQRERVLGYIEIGKQEGAVPVAGGGRPAHLDRGWFVEPTVFRDVKSDMRIAQEEIFGPVVAFIPYSDEEEAISIANDSAFGLHGTVWTTDVDKGVGIGRRIRTGTYSVNAMSLDPAVPFGGVKDSGIGREMGPEGLAAYLEPKTITVPV